MKFLALISLAFLFPLSPAEAAVYLTPAEALGIYFPAPAKVEKNALYLSSDEVEKVKNLAKAPFDENVLSYYIGVQNEETLGYAFFETHRVRAMEETVMVAIDPQGKILGVEILAFFEPEDYKPSSRWLDQLQGKELDNQLWVKRGLRNIAGSTLSARAITDASRRALALYQFVREAK